MTATVPWRVSGQNSITLAMLETPMSTYNPTNLTEMGPTTAVANSAHHHSQSIFQGTAHLGAEFNLVLTFFPQIITIYIQINKNFRNTKI
jgi:hypothetical protein